jgi:multicomponent Na+:H+ antiporter subunit G
VSVLGYFGAALVLAGAAFAFSGGVGLLRLPDFYTRTHAAGVTDTAGAGLLLLGLLLQADSAATGVRLIMILVFLLITSPTATHILAQTALKDGLKPLLASKTER